MRRIWMLTLCAVISGAIGGAIYWKLRPQQTSEAARSRKPAGTLSGVARHYGSEKPRFTETNQGGRTQTFDDESLVVDPDTRGLKWVMVRIMDVPVSDPPPVTDLQMSIDLKFDPHVLVVPPGRNVLILNHGFYMHNFHTTAFDFSNLQQNFVLPRNSLRIYKGEWTKETELIQVKDDICMGIAYMLVHDPRYCAVTRADGRFEISDIPAGTYQMDIWHERFGNYPRPRSGRGPRKEPLSVTIKVGERTEMGELRFEK